MVDAVALESHLPWGDKGYHIRSVDHIVDAVIRAVFRAQGLREIRSPLSCFAGVSEYPVILAGFA